MDADANAVIEFWFGAIGQGNTGTLEEWNERMQRWFMGGPAFDREIHDRFAQLHARASQGALDEWADTPRGLLALVIVLDQFSRNIHRGTLFAFAQDSKARSLTTKALDRGDDRTMAWYE